MTSTRTALLTAVTIETPEHIETLRQIRNACASGFVYDHSEVSPQRQRAWWSFMRDRVHAWLYLMPDADPVGYGLVRQTDDGRWWNSIAVLPRYRGQGFGAYITADVLRRHPYPVYATVCLDNLGAALMHHVADWEEVELDLTNGLLTLRSRQSAHERTDS